MVFPTIFQQIIKFQPFTSYVSLAFLRMEIRFERYKGGADGSISDKMSDFYGWQIICIFDSLFLGFKFSRNVVKC